MQRFLPAFGALSDLVKIEAEKLETQQPQSLRVMYGESQRDLSVIH